MSRINLNNGYAIRVRTSSVMLAKLCGKLIVSHQLKDN
ncbi:hypothetical protein CES85_1589 [Ochrobactrum quorumnocens]|uniref:Transposase n=1 Tax=Ochrobactrum quorumnocens TaxID=271865 RepID=A0A248UHR3_9HYPH|nr:hypothetical protein CES85_1589 [[Ochrobactrum] quorumnocens]